MEELSPRAKDFLAELDRISMLPFRWEEEKIIVLLQEFYENYGMKFPSKIEKCVDIFNERLINLVDRQAWQAGQARQARQSEWAWQAWQAGQARQAWQAGQARQAWQAWQAGQARQARQARQSEWAGQARQAWQSEWAGQARQARQARQYASDFYEDVFVVTEVYGYDHPLNDSDKKFLNGQKILLKAKEAGLGFFFDDEENGILYLVPCAVVKLNARNMHHSDTSPSIEWKDGAKFYYLNGVKFEEDLWQKVVSKKMTFKEISAIVDIDQRRQAMKYCGEPNAMLKELGATLIDGETDKGNWLWLVPQDKGLFTEDVYFLTYRDTSTNEWHLKGVKPELGKIGSADEAQSASHHFTLAQYLSQDLIES